MTRGPDKVAWGRAEPLARPTRPTAHKEEIHRRQRRDAKHERNRTNGWAHVDADLTVPGEAALTFTSTRAFYSPVLVQAVGATGSSVRRSTAKG